MTFRPFKVIQGHRIWHHRKRVCDFLLVRNSNFGPILHRFKDFGAFVCSWPNTYFTQILGVSPLHQTAHFGYIYVKRISLKLFGREIIFEEFQPMRSRYLNVTDRRTDRQTTCNLITALCVASLGKNVIYTVFQKKVHPFYFHYN